MSSDEFTFSDDNAADWIEVNTIEFETWILDEQTNTLRRSDAELPKPAQPPLFYQLSAHLFVKQASFGAAGNSELRRSGSARYRTTTVGKYQLAKEGWTIVTADDLQPAAKSATYSEAEQSLEKLKVQNPSRALKIVRLSEVQK